MNFLIAILRRAFREEDGQATVLVAVSFTALLAFAGLAVDVGQMHIVQRQVQSAADASALAGALELGDCGTTTDCAAMTAAAQDAVTENGLAKSLLVKQCGSTGSAALAVTVNNGPCALGSSSADPNYKNASYVETVVSKVQPTIFAKVLGISSLTISARAEATVGNSPFCLDMVGTSGMTFQNNGGDLTLSCGIMINSSGNPAFQANGGTTSATAIDVNGEAQVWGGTVTPQPVTGVPALKDPLSYLNPPENSGCTYNSTISISSNQSLSPGTYCGGLQINGGAVTLKPGVYTFDSFGFQMNGGSVSGSGVTFYFAQGSSQFNGAYTVNLVAPTTGNYAGILFYQSSTDATTMQINGGPDSVFQGALYAPDAPIQLNGSNVAAYTIVDASSIQMNGGNFSLGSNYSSLPGGSPAKTTTSVLVE